MPTPTPTNLNSLVINKVSSYDDWKEKYSSSAIGADDLIIIPPTEIQKNLESLNPSPSDGDILAYSEDDGVVWVPFPDDGFSPSNNGTANVGQFLKKTADGYAWDSIRQVPPGGTTGDVLKKTDKYEWASINEVPLIGTTGYVLKKTDGGYGWASINEVPPFTTEHVNKVLTVITSNGSAALNWSEISNTGFSPSNTGETGQFLKKTENGYSWDSINQVPLTVDTYNKHGLPRQVLMRTSEGYEWDYISTFFFITNAEHGTTLDVDDINKRLLFVEDFPKLSNFTIKIGRVPNTSYQYEFEILMYTDTPLIVTTNNLFFGAGLSNNGVQSITINEKYKSVVFRSVFQHWIVQGAYSAT